MKNRPGRKLLKTATNDDIKSVASARGLEFTDEDCDELRVCPDILFGTHPRDGETVAQAVDDFVRAYEG
jgi:hypothetical protein